MTLGEAGAPVYKRGLPSPLAPSTALAARLHTPLSPASLVGTPHFVPARLSANFQPPKSFLKLAPRPCIHPLLGSPSSLPRWPGPGRIPGTHPIRKSSRLLRAMNRPRRVLRARRLRGLTQRTIPSTSSPQPATHSQGAGQLRQAMLGAGAGPGSRPAGAEPAACCRATARPTPRTPRGEPTAGFSGPAWPLAPSATPPPRTRPLGGQVGRGGFVRVRTLGTAVPHGQTNAPGFWGASTPTPSTVFRGGLRTVVCLLLGQHLGAQDLVLALHPGITH